MSRSESSDRGAARRRRREGDRRRARAPTPDTAQAGDGEGRITLVGVGASAGGLEALRSFISHLPAGAGLSFAIAQHLDPKHASQLTPLLARGAALKVVELVDGQEPEADVVYVTPPDTNVTCESGVLRLRKPPAVVRPKPSVDVFFASLAEDLGERAVGVVLSGTGTDGAHGVRALKAAGGFTFAQDEDSAKYNGMPRAAADTGCVDFVLPPARIAAELVAIAAHATPGRRRAHTPEATTHLGRILRELRARTGTDFAEYRTSTILRRVDRRMAAHRLERISEYADYVERSPGEVDLLFKDILISVTSFFRDPETFEAVGARIDAIVRKKSPGDPLRIWVAGCATGEEAYSLAMLLSERLGARATELRLQLFATDIDGDATVRARRGVYPSAVVAELEPRLRERYFVPVGSEFQVVKRLRERIVFARQDLTRDPPFSHLDLVSCRNVLIYFNSGLQKRILSMFHYVLEPHGCLVLGRSESAAQASEFFSPVDGDNKIFRRRAGVAVPQDRKGRLARWTARQTRSEPLAAQRRDAPPEQVGLEALVEGYTPPSVLLDDRLEVVHVYGDVSDYLRVPPGRPGLDILRLCRTELGAELRAVLHRARERGEVEAGRRIVLAREDGADEAAPRRSVRIVVRSLSREEDRGLFLVSFEAETTDGLPTTGPDSTPAVAGSGVAELEQEIARSREQLHTVAAELESANEELLTLNEELEAANEELQSSNEELETANEELQSTNEELMTVNEELNVKSTELATVHVEVDSILDGIGYGLVAVDAELRVIRYNTPATALFSLEPGDIGAPLGSLPTRLRRPALEPMLRTVIREGLATEREVGDGDRVFWLRASPRHDEPETVSGAILTFIDKTDVRRAERLLREEEARFALAQEAGRFARWDWEIGTDALSFSPGVEEVVGVPADHLGETLPAFLAAVHPDDRAGFRDALRAAVERDETPSAELRVVAPDGTGRWISATGRCLRDGDGRAARLTGVLASVDDRRAVEGLAARGRTLLEAIDGAAFVTDLKRSVRFANRRFLEAHGGEQRVLDRSCADIVCEGRNDCEGAGRGCPVIRTIAAGDAGAAPEVSEFGGVADDADTQVVPITDERGRVSGFLHVPGGPDSNPGAPRDAPADEG